MATGVFKIENTPGRKHIQQINMCFGFPLKLLVVVHSTFSTSAISRWRGRHMPGTNGEALHRRRRGRRAVLLAPR